MYYCCGSQLESKNPHMTFRATGFPYGFFFPFLLSLLRWITAWMLMPVSSHCDRKSLFFEWCNCLVTSCISVSLSLLRFKCKLVYFQKKYFFFILAGRKMTLKKITDVPPKWTQTPHTHAMVPKLSRVSFLWSLYQLVWVCVWCRKKESSWTETHSLQLSMNHYILELDLTHHSVTLSTHFVYFPPSLFQRGIKRWVIFSTTDAYT